MTELVGWIVEFKRIGQNYSGRELRLNGATAINALARRLGVKAGNYKLAELRNRSVLFLDASKDFAEAVGKLPQVAAVLQDVPNRIVFASLPRKTEASAMPG